MADFEFRVSSWIVDSERIGGSCARTIGVYLVSQSVCTETYMSRSFYSLAFTEEVLQFLVPI